MTTGGALGESGLYRLMSWLSPGFPVGAFSYSHGVEYAIEAGLVGDGDGLQRWIDGIIRYGAGRVDADLFRDAWQAQAGAGDLAATVELANAMRGSREMALESTAQGTAFLDAVRGTASDPAVIAAMQRLSEIDRKPAYAVAVADAAASVAVPLRPALAAFLHARAANKLAATCGRYPCTIRCGRGEQRVDAQSIMSLMLLAAPKGSGLEFAFDGDEEQAAAAARAGIRTGSCILERAGAGAKRVLISG